MTPDPHDYGPPEYQPEEADPFAELFYDAAREHDAAEDEAFEASHAAWLEWMANPRG